jgi:hypothetical protein
LTAQQLGAAIGHHEADKVQLEAMARGADKRHLHIRYRTLLKHLIEGHDQAIVLLREELRRTEMESGPPSE